MNGLPTGLSELPSYLVNVLLNPSFNPRIAFILYAWIGLFLLLVLLIGIALLMRGPNDQPGAQKRHSEAASSSRLRNAPPRRVSPRSRPLVAAVVALVMIAVWSIAGYTTSESAVCKDCHWPAARHAKAAAGSDHHANVPCVSCHETGGTFGRYLTGVPARLIHFADSQSALAPQLEYGHVMSAACTSCHAVSLKGVATNETRGLKISHKEPLGASATCTDCHGMKDGVIGAYNAGMTSCLRCHDAKRASAECGTCHDEKAASAARVRTTSFADVQIPNVSCGGCHDEKQECDTCHGMRLPHSAEFKAYAHARAGAVDFWYNGGKGCSRCHNAARRPCQKCHGQSLGKAHGTGMTWLATGHQTALAAGCDRCHLQYAHLATRDFCKDICHTPAAKAASPR